MPISSQARRSGWAIVLKVVPLDHHLGLMSLQWPILLSFSCNTEVSGQRLLRNLVSAILIDYLNNFVVKILQLVLCTFSHIQHLKVKFILIFVILA